MIEAAARMLKRKTRPEPASTQKCVITGSPAKYRDPLTKLPYATIVIVDGDVPSSVLMRNLNATAYCDTRIQKQSKQTECVTKYESCFSNIVFILLSMTL